MKLTKDPKTLQLDPAGKMLTFLGARILPFCSIVGDSGVIDCNTVLGAKGWI